MPSYPSVRLYGPMGGTNSFRALSRGIEGALKSLGVKYAVCPTDAQMDEEWGDTGGRGYDVGLYVGNPSFLQFVSAHTRHARKFCMVAPNGYGVPGWVFRYAEADGIDIVCPSPWAVEVCRPLTKSAVHYFPHGASTSPPTEVQASLKRRRIDELRQGGEKVRLLHTTSTASDRKGTWTLLRTWMDLGAHEWATLAVHAPPEVASRFPATPGVTMSTDKIHADNWGAVLRHYDMVVQPSAAEGFGLVPLEALCAGVPVLLTAATGEAAYINDPMFKDTDVDATPFMLSAALPRGPVAGEEEEGHPPGHSSLASSLVTANGLLRIGATDGNPAHSALSWAPRIHARWSWEAVTSHFLLNLPPESP